MRKISIWNRRGGSVETMMSIGLAGLDALLRAVAFDPGRAEAVPVGADARQLPVGGPGLLVLLANGIRHRPAGFRSRCECLCLGQHADQAEDGHRHHHATEAPRISRFDRPRSVARPEFMFHSMGTGPVVGPGTLSPWTWSTSSLTSSPSAFSSCSRRACCSS